MRVDFIPPAERLRETVKGFRKHLDRTERAIAAGGGGVYSLEELHARRAGYHRAIARYEEAAALIEAEEKA